MTVTDVYGDFVYIGKAGTWSDNVVVYGSTFLRDGRMGVSITAAHRVLIQDNTFDQMRRSTFDMEAHDPGFGADYVTILDNKIGAGRCSSLRRWVSAR